MRIAVVYNACGISGKDRQNLPYYLRALGNLFEHFAGTEHKVVVSGCMMNPEVKKDLKSFCGSLATMIWVDEPLPLNITMNHAVLKFRSDFTHYVYLASDVDVGESSLVDLCRVVQGEIAVASALVDRDTGAEWLGVQPPKDKPVRFLPGKTCNLHCQAWSAEFVQEYGRVLPDIFPSDCSEQVTPYLCSAIRRQFVWAPVPVHHEHNLDVASSGFRRGSGDSSVCFRSAADLRQGKYSPVRPLWEEGRKVGWGFEEFCTDMKHDPGFFDSNGYSVNSGLFNWLKENLFLDFDYNTVKCEIQ
ncbi:MAG: hypothetical protein KGJ09_09665 [Candidatus Omnitrophica bacterium]|nr:hypothetical protein [Candidatus Omnitrophota bacterium]